MPPVSQASGQAAPKRDPKLLDKLLQARNVAALDAKANVQGIPDPSQCNGLLQDDDPELVSAMKRIVKSLATGILVARRFQIYRAGRAELYNLGKQNSFWAGADEAWMGVTSNGSIVPADASDAEGTNYTLNFYKGYCESFETAASQAVPSVPFHPEDSNRGEDIEAAKSATDASEFISRNNDAPMLMQKLAYHGFNSGLFAVYVRSVTDGQRFGWEPDPDTGELTDVPKSRELLSVHGALDITVPLWADNQAECDYLSWHLDIPKSLAKATYPWAASKIATTGTLSDDDLLARLFRVAVRGNIRPTMPADALEDMVTLLRIWVRPSRYWEITDDDLRNKLLEKFPAGFVSHWCGGSYCAAMNESLDDHWTIECASEGRGMARPGIGDSFIEVQDQINILSNLFHQYLIYGIPPIFHDAKALNREALKNWEASPAQYMPVNMREGMDDLRKLFWNPDPAQVPAALISRLDSLAGAIGQFLTGIYPALMGAGLEGAAQDTAHGMQIQLNQAMGRVALFYRRMRSVYQRSMLLAVREFARNRDKDVSLSIGVAASTKKPRRIDPIAIRKGNFNVYPEADEGYPALYSDKRGLLQQLMQMASKDPALAAALDDPANQAYFKSVFGLSELVIAGETSRQKQLKEIDDLLSGVPVEIGLLDRDQIHVDTIQEWAESESGMAAQLEDPQGYGAVMQHAEQHQARMKQNAKPPAKPLSESFTAAYKDLEPEAKVQVLQAMGINITVDQITNFLKSEHMAEVLKERAKEPLPEPTDDSQDDQAAAA